MFSSEKGVSNSFSPMQRSLSEWRFEFLLYDSRVSHSARKREIPNTYLLCKDRLTKWYLEFLFIQFTNVPMRRLPFSIPSLCTDTVRLNSQPRPHSSRALSQSCQAASPHNPHATPTQKHNIRTTVILSDRPLTQYRRRTRSASTFSFPLQVELRADANEGIAAPSRVGRRERGIPSVQSVRRDVLRAGVVRVGIRRAGMIMRRRITAGAMRRRRTRIGEVGALTCGDVGQQSGCTLQLVEAAVELVESFERESCGRFCTALVCTALLLGWRGRVLLSCRRGGALP